MTQGQGGTCANVLGSPWGSEGGIAWALQEERGANAPTRCSRRGAFVWVMTTGRSFGLRGGEKVKANENKRQKTGQRDGRARHQSTQTGMHQAQQWGTARTTSAACVRKVVDGEHALGRPDERPVWGWGPDTMARRGRRLFQPHYV